MKNMKKIGFLVHARNHRDLIRKFPLLRYAPRRLVDWIAISLPPIIVSRITGLTNRGGESIDGYIIGMTMTARQMIEHREKATKKIIQACKFAERRGVGIIGLGALTASFSKGGLDVLPHVKEMGVTTGRAYTTKTVTDYVKHCIDIFGFDKTTARIAIVGAGGSVGSSCAKLLAAWGVRNMLFIDLPKRAEHLLKSIENLKNTAEGINVEISHAISDIKGWDIIITATNAPEALIHEEDLSPGTIIVNDAQPSDVPKEVIVNRKDILVIEGGVIHTPGIKCNFNLGLVDREDTFCCLGEVLILAQHERFEHFATGELQEHLVGEIEKMSEGMGFSIAKFQNDVQHHIPESQISHVREIIAGKLRERAL
jgi:fatty aldehyde-generating acyl-ACP reductase